MTVWRLKGVIYVAQKVPKKLRKYTPPPHLFCPFLIYKLLIKTIDYYNLSSKKILLCQKTWQYQNTWNGCQWRNRLFMVLLQLAHAKQPNADLFDQTRSPAPLVKSKVSMLDHSNQTMFENWEPQCIQWSHIKLEKYFNIENYTLHFELIHVFKGQLMRKYSPDTDIR